MSQNDSGTTQESISERLHGIWSELSRNQRRFVVAMQEFPTKKEAANSIGLEADTVYRWPNIVDEAIGIFSEDVETAALAIISRSVGKAAMIKATGLDSGDEKVRQLSATEILDRVLGKPMQKQEITGSGGGPVGLVILPSKDKGDGK